MPVPQYGLLKGRPTARDVHGPAHKPPHLHITLSAPGGPFDVAVNILSGDGSEILYQVNHAFVPAHAGDLLAMPAGRKLLPHGNALALDYVHQGIVKVDDMTSLSAQDAQHLTASDLHNEIDDMVLRAINDPEAHFFAFGSKFTEGIHDIHMNQGNPLDGPFAQDNGTSQDGALMAFFPSEQRWLAVFIAFQSQSWTTDDNGDPA